MMVLTGVSASQLPYSFPRASPRDPSSHISPPQYRCSVIPVALQGSLRRIPQFLYSFKDPVADLVFDNVPKRTLSSKIYLFV